MCENNQSFLVFLEDLLEELSRLDGRSPQEKYALARKEIHRRTKSVFIPKLGLIYVKKNCCGKKSCASSYEITQLKKITKVNSFTTPPKEIDLPEVENSKLFHTLRTKERLRQLKEDSVSKIIHYDEWIYARLFRVIDGDTLLLGLDLGETSLKISLRVIGVDCPETKKTCTLEMKAGQAAKKYVEKLYERVCIVRVKLTALDKWGGRWVGYAEVPGGKGVCNCGCIARGNCLSTVLLAKGLAKRYEGKKKEEWTEGELTRIASLC